VFDINFHFSSTIYVMNAKTLDVTGALASLLTIFHVLPRVYLFTDENVVLASGLCEIFALVFIFIYNF